MSALPPNSTIGMVGGGQLGRMLAMAAARLGYRVIVLDPQADCPATQVANRQIVADFDDPDGLDELADACAVVTYEFENVPVASARRIEARTPVLPPPRALEVAQDRVVEKAFLNSIGVPTARFAAVDDDRQLAILLEQFGGNGVLKTRRMGYDGKGQRVLRTQDDGLPAGIFASMGGVPLILEELVAFEREISVIAARDRVGRVVCYDAAENIHRGGILHSSTVPASVPAETAAAAAAAAAALLRGLDYVGVIGVEFFVTRDGGLLANEFAPRVHNSGHWTEAACAVSQFEQHIRAVVGLPLGSPHRHSDCVMENLIGDDVSRLGDLASETDVLVHLYGKAETRPGRKMGHFTRLRPGMDGARP